jgi:hypothetical protein
LSGYLQSRVMSAVYGERRETMERVLTLRALRDDLAELKPGDQVLAIDLRNRDPAQAFTTVPLEKGRLFLTFLDARFGHERFDAFLRGYFDHFAFKTISTEQFVKYLGENLLARFPGIVSQDEVLAWVGTPGIPADAVLPESAVYAAVDEALAAFASGRTAAKTLDTREWVAQQWMYFLDGLPSLTMAQLKDLDDTFGFSRSTNAEIERGWFSVVIRNRYQPGYARLENYLLTMGRRTLVAPLYLELMKTPAGAAQAVRVYKLARPNYARQTAAVIDAIVNPHSDPDEIADE